MKKMPGAPTILLGILIAVMAASWLIPSVSFSMAYDESLGYETIDETSVRKEPPNGILPWRLPEILIDGTDNVFSTVVLICACNSAFAVLNASGVFSRVISWLCRKFRNRELRLLLLLFCSFSALGLVVIPHCFIAFVPTAVALAIQMGYDPVVGLAMVLFGATTAAMTGPLSAVTAMCQESVGLPVYSGAGVRFLLFFVFLGVNAWYLCRYASRVQRDPGKSLLPHYKPEQPAGDGGAGPLTARHIAALASLAAVFAVVVVGSTSLGFTTVEISGIFLIFAVLAGLLLKYSVSQTFQFIVGGLEQSMGTVLVICLAGAVTEALKQSGIMETLLYCTSRAFSLLPGFLTPAAMLLLIGLFNCLLPSGPAKGVMLMPLLGPVGQLSGMSMQTSVLAYNLGDSFTNYLLPYDTTTASYLEAARVPFQVWVRFVLRLFFIWNLVGIAFLTILYFTGYGPF